ncbi:unnamed protein product [Prorocentrum cordatum]|uniref:SWIM-type domain-containing protein n=1 Tax=Prorocentrum cordatum TaxID=2364126 RepID=A0ABN9PPD7_9DINO|nr:unnamed protein product [Polarella glacialis]
MRGIGVDTIGWNIFLANTWGVSAQWLRQFAQRLAFQHASFDSEAKVYRELAEVVPFRADLKLQRAWIARRAMGLTDSGRSINTLVIDGNAKLARRHTATQCSCKPGFKLKRCSKHLARALTEDDGPPQSEIIVSHKRRRVLETAPRAEPCDVCLAARDQKDIPGAPRRWAAARQVTQGQLQEYWGNAGHQAHIPAMSPDADLQSVSCRTHKEAHLGRASRGSTPGQFSRRCGWLYACTPEGYIVHLKEYVGAESLPQRYFFLAEVVEKAPAVDFVRHDDACDLRRCASKREGDGAFARRLAYPNIKYITDGLRDRNHVDPWRLANCSPKADCNKELVKNINSQICEQLFSSLGRHKYSVRRMGQFTSAFLLTELAEVKNEAWLAEQARAARAGASAGQPGAIGTHHLVLADSWLEWEPDSAPARGGKAMQQFRDEMRAVWDIVDKEYDSRVALGQKASQAILTLATRSSHHEFPFGMGILARLCACTNGALTSIFPGDPSPVVLPVVNINYPQTRKSSTHRVGLVVGRAIVDHVLATASALATGAGPGSELRFAGRSSI